MITLIINYKDQIVQYMKMLTEEVGKASNIKSRVTRQNVTDALTSTMEKLKFCLLLGTISFALYFADCLTVNTSLMGQFLTFRASLHFNFSLRK